MLTLNTSPAKLSNLALTRSRLVHVDQYYLRTTTIAAANAALIEAQARVPIVQFWGNGLLASVDGLRFVVPVRTINAAPSPKYFAKKKGVRLAERDQRLRWPASGRWWCPAPT